MKPADSITAIAPWASLIGVVCLGLVGYGRVASQAEDAAVKSEKAVEAVAKVKEDLSYIRAQVDILVQSVVKKSDRPEKQE
jgi:hypothetical protein